MNAVKNLLHMGGPKFLTQCRLCNHPVAETDALEIPIIGQPGRKVEKLMTLLVKHLTKHHGDQLMKGAALIQEFQAFMILSAFAYEDPSMAPRLENIRAAVFALVRKNTMTDASLQHIVAGFGLDPEDAAKVTEAYSNLRDCFCELGAFAPEFPEQSQIVNT